MGKILGQDRVKKSLEVAVKRDLPALLVGETGTGKTSLIRELAAKHQRHVARFNMTGETSVEEFVGKYTLITNDNGSETLWQNGMLVDAMVRGHWLVVDEINMALPEIITVLHSLLDDDKFVTLANHDGEIVRPHENFRFFATMNPPDEYAGTKELNKAFVSRFAIIEEVCYPNKVTEKNILKAEGVEEMRAMQMVDVANQIRAEKENGRLYYTCSTRDLLHWARLTEDLAVQRAYDLAIINKAPNDKQALKEVYREVFKLYEEFEGQDDGLLAITEYQKRSKELEQREQRVTDMEAHLKAETLKLRDQEVKSAEAIRAELRKEMNAHLENAIKYLNDSI